MDSVGGSVPCTSDTLLANILRYSAEDGRRTIRGTLLPVLRTSFPEYMVRAWWPDGL